MEIAVRPVGHGVADHSRALRDPIGRFRNTTAYIYLVSFGTPAERDAVIRIVNRAHRPVRSAPGAEVGYTAFDPDLQLWDGIVVDERVRGYGAALYRATPRRARELPRNLLLRASRLAVAAHH